MSGTQIDFTKYEAQAPAPQIDFSKYESKPAAPADKPKSIWERMGIVPAADATPPPLKPGEQAGPSGDGSPGEMLNTGLTQGSKELGKYYATQGPGQMVSGAGDIVKGDIAKGGHKVISGAGVTLLPIMPEAIAANPLMAARAVGGGIVGSKVAGAGAQALGANPDQQQFTEDIGNLAGGTAAATGVLRAFLQSPTKALLGKAAGALDGVVSDDVLGMVSPRALHGLRMLRAANKIASGTAEPELSSIATKHTEAISGLESQLNEALSKANALPPEGPTATIKDVPDLRVQPSQQAPQNLLAKPLPGKPQMRQGGTFQVVPPENAITPSGKVTPNMEIYNEEIQPPKPLKPPTLLAQMREWDNIRKIHAQLEDQIGKGQDEIQQWMEDHNRQEAGGASTAAKAKFNAAKAAALPDTPTVAYRVRDAGETGIMPKGHAQATTDLEQAQSYVPGRGDAQNAPQEVVKVDLAKMKPADYQLMKGPGGKTWVKFKEAVPESMIEKVADEPRVPKDDADLESLLMKSVQAAKAKKARAASAGD